jgi:hypothetical protein
VCDSACVCDLLNLASMLTSHTPHHVHVDTRTDAERAQPGASTDRSTLLPTLNSTPKKRRSCSTKVGGAPSPLFPFVFWHKLAQGSDRVPHHQSSWRAHVLCTPPLRWGRAAYSIGAKQGCRRVFLRVESLAATCEKHRCATCLGWHPHPPPTEEREDHCLQAHLNCCAGLSAPNALKCVSHAANIAPPCPPHPRVPGTLFRVSHALTLDNRDDVQRCQTPR